MGQYGEQKYWEERYNTEQAPFDWYLRYQHLKPLLAPFMTDESCILDIGCGSSKLAEELYDDGKKNIKCIDYSANIINKMQDANISARPEIDWAEMDVKAMSFDDETFDLIIDKGTSDAILCGTDSYAQLSSMLKEVSRVLKKGGVYVVITYGVPATRLPHFEKEEYGWKVDKLTTPKYEGAPPNQVYYLYVMKKVSEEKEEERNDQEDEVAVTIESDAPPKMSSPGAETGASPSTNEGNGDENLIDFDPPPEMQ
ncbi:putative Endothelin-converting enzyme 2 B (Ece2B) [Monocercomonoides exilis]|uniref:putative Endothelin-converting enzyme 2 B (Ece2B) n=1 Tax=Monocercomonoides exilis TaxID=2049356 RepID=UPI00355A9308|nr:putative Endothelin-converting enzyme 2 B (Ece2B) [Monocercomonoides exilis]|eukprot:MONOS_12518.1-p1 / transcript=MONOS_12518.1 / gene=MONOS_12518 / organism=Monocercomonoides_exilis_PA203 / gene_product=Endothelin-converting enzyme 2 B (Ece2B) / transcript_product=Endothelin-converting enzyme 2 B (Ece2B) / location=Mono_scaffold00697:16777-17718(-) / protein_length=255 / sequence_SO=supercontig / SO=protein_coding / is_pseudo=false